MFIGRPKTLLTNCKKELETWIHRIENAISHESSKAKQRWKKIIVAVDKPKLMDLAAKVSSYNVQIQAMLAVMQGYDPKSYLVVQLVLTEHQRSWRIHKYCRYERC
jgi:hypothetical protein